MAGKPQYKREQIYWILFQVFKFGITNNDFIMAGFEQKFGRKLEKAGLRYVKTTYGTDDKFK